MPMGSLSHALVSWTLAKQFIILIQVKMSGVWAHLAMSGAGRSKAWSGHCVIAAALRLQAAAH